MEKYKAREKLSRGFKRTVQGKLESIKLQSEFHCVFRLIPVKKLSLLENDYIFGAGAIAQSRTLF